MLLWRRTYFWKSIRLRTSRRNSSCSKFDYFLLWYKVTHVSDYRMCLTCLLYSFVHMIFFSYIRMTSNKNTSLPVPANVHEFDQYVARQEKILANRENALMNKEKMFEEKESRISKMSSKVSHSICCIVLIWDGVFKNEPSKICERPSLKNLEGYGLLKQTIPF